MGPISHNRQSGRCSELAGQLCVLSNVLLCFTALQQLSIVPLFSCIRCGRYPVHLKLEEYRLSLHQQVVGCRFGANRCLAPTDICRRPGRPSLLVQVLTRPRRRISATRATRYKSAVVSVLPRSVTHTEQEASERNPALSSTYMR